MIINDTVKIKTSKFGIGYSKGRPKYTFGKVHKEGKVKSYLIVITWVDDCRFFGTENLVKEYEETISKNCRCTSTLEGVSREFVSMEINHQVEEGILELTQNEYWVKAVDR